MQRTLITMLLLTMALLVGCGDLPSQSSSKSNKEQKESLAELRSRLKTQLLKQKHGTGPVDPPPKGVLDLVSYDTSIGKMAAYVSPSPKDGKRHPAIVWIVGGFDNDIGSPMWEPAPAENDQSARAFREAGVITMYPSLRGGNENPGLRECFLGEVDDVLAATKWLASLDYVDSSRIYLGGHSTGGTLVLLAAELSDQYRAIFSFGPGCDATNYGKENIPFNPKDDVERIARSPIYWLKQIKSTTVVIEGMEEGNYNSLKLMSEINTNTNIKFLPVKSATHFSTLKPITTLIAKRIIADTGPTTNINLTEAELNAFFSK